MSAVEVALEMVVNETTVTAVVDIDYKEKLLVLNTDNFLHRSIAEMPEGVVVGVVMRVLVEMASWSKLH